MKKCGKAYWIAFILLWGFASGTAQVNYYSFGQSITSYHEINSGVLLGNPANALTSVFTDSTNPLNDQNASGVGFDIGFPFVFRGIIYDRIGISALGWIFLGQSSRGNAAVNEGVPNAFPLEINDLQHDTLRSRIAGFSTYLKGNGTNSALRILLSGTTPDRICTIQWKNYKVETFYPNASNINFQIRLHETDQTVEFVYGDCSFEGIIDFFPVDTGLGGLTSDEYINRNTNTDDWNNTIQGSSNFSYCYVKDDVIAPVPGTTFKFIPATCVPPQGVIVSTPDTNSLTVSWMPPYTFALDGYRYLLDDQPEPPEEEIGSITFDDSIHIQNLDPGTTYFFHIKSNCAPSDQSAWLTIEAFTLCPVTPLPYFENFDGVTGDEIPACMHISNNLPFTPTWHVEDNANEAISPPNSFRIDDNNLPPDWVMSPALFLQKDTSYITMLDARGGEEDSLEIFIGDLPLPSHMHPLAYIITSGNFRQRYQTFTVDSTNRYFIGYLFHFNYGAVDNLEIRKNDCQSPDSIRIFSNEADHIQIEWNRNSTGDNLFEYVVLSPDHAYPFLNIHMVDDTIITLTTLNGSTDYILAVRTICGGGIFSPWIEFPFSTVSANDECEDAIAMRVSVMPYCEESFQGSTKGAHPGSLPPGSCGGNPDDDVWFSFTASHSSHGINFYPDCPKGYPGWTDPTFPACEAYTIEIYKYDCNGELLICHSFQQDQYQDQLYIPDCIPDSNYLVRIFGTGAYWGGSNFSICAYTVYPPENDSCQTAELLESNGSVCDNFFYYGNLAASTATPDLPSNCGTGPYHDIWYKFVVIDTAEIIEVSFSDDVDGAIQAFTGSCNNLQPIGCSNHSTTGSEYLTLHQLTTGDTIYFRLFEANGSDVSSNVTICIRTVNPNEFCTGALTIENITNHLFEYSLTGNTLTASGEGGCESQFADDDLWYRFTAVSDTQLIVVSPTGFPNLLNPVIEFYSGPCNTSSDTCTTSGELLLNTLIAGNDYLYRIYSAGDGTGQGGFSTTVITPAKNLQCHLADTIFANSGESCITTNILSNEGSSLDNSVWFTFEALSSIHLFQFSGISLFNANLTLYSNCDSLPIANGNAYQWMKGMDLHPGQYYFIKVQAPIFNTTFFQGAFSLCIVTPPENDECANAINMTPANGCENVYQVSTLACTESEQVLACNQNGKDIWYKFKANSTHHTLTMYPDSGYIACRGELRQGGCPGQSLLCFENSPFNNSTTVLFAGLQIDSIYYLRLIVSDFLNGINGRGKFQMCLSTPPLNDDCDHPDFIEASLTRKCTHLTSGTTKYATNSSNGTANVWYEVISPGSSLAFEVFPITDGFDPGIRFWELSSSGGEQDHFCTTTTASSPITGDDTHVYGQPEALTIGGMTPDKHYLIEVYNGDSSHVSGDFDICIFNPNNTLKIYSADDQTYEFTDTVGAGKWRQAVTNITLHVSGYVNAPHITKAVINNAGSTRLTDIFACGLYYDNQPWDAANQFGFKIFGKPGSGLSGYPIPSLLGSMNNNPTSQYTVNGDIVMQGIQGSANFPFKRNYTQHMYIVHDVNCGAVLNDTLRAKAINLTIGDEVFPVFHKAHPGLVIKALDTYDTKNNGNWENGNTWMCGSPPPSDHQLKPININHTVNLNDTRTTGNISVKYLESLIMNPGSVLTLGRSSSGNQTGFSNKYFECIDGSLFMNHANLEVNGRFEIGHNGIPSAGQFSAHYSNLTIDGFDGTIEGSTNYPGCIISSENVQADHIHINILDPIYNSTFYDFVFPAYNPIGQFANVLSFGGGDDTPQEPYKDGFYFRNLAFMFDTIYASSGMDTGRRALYSVGNFITCHNLKVDTGCEFIGRAAITGDLINNGLVTIPENNFLSFCGNVNITNHFTNTSNSQAIRGNGFFRAALTDPIPATRENNVVTSLFLSNTYSGLDLYTPLTVKDILRLRQGNIHNSDTSLLTLGLPENPGRLITFPNETFIFMDVPFNGNVGNWDGGHVEGPMRRYFNGMATPEQQIIPLGVEGVSRGISIAFQEPQSGYIHANFINQFPGVSGMPLINEQQTDIHSPGFGYWNVLGNGMSGTYSTSVNATGFTFDHFIPMTDLANVRLIQRPVNGQWHLSGSTTITPPLALNFVQAENIQGISDFGIGTTYCKVVTNGNDDGLGSLRYAIDECSVADDYILITDFVDSIHLSSDTIVIDKNLFILGAGLQKTVIVTSSANPEFSISANVTSTLYNLELHAGGQTDARALLNAGTTKLIETDIFNSLPGRSPIINSGQIEVSGNVRIKKE